MSKEHNPWKGFVVGVLGAMAGLAAMRMYWQKVAPVVKERFESEGQGGETSQEKTRALDDVAIFGLQYQEGESSTAALGRMAYTRLTGNPPETEETKTTLGYLAHWAYGMLQGGVYGAMQGEADWPDLQTGLLFGTALWLYGDEAFVPLLGLQSGPTAVTTEQHLNRWGAHLAYGAATALATQTLYRIL